MYGERREKRMRHWDNYGGYPLWKSSPSPYSDKNRNIRFPKAGIPPGWTSTYEANHGIFPGSPHSTSKERSWLRIKPYPGLCSPRHHQTTGSESDIKKNDWSWALMERFTAGIVQESSDKVGHEVWISLRKREYASYQFRCRPGEVYEMLLRIRMSSVIGTCM
jgi:hypothetical protein